MNAPKTSENSAMSQAGACHKLQRTTAEMDALLLRVHRQTQTRRSKIKSILMCFLRMFALLFLILPLSRAPPSLPPSLSLSLARAPQQALPIFRSVAQLMPAQPIGHQGLQDCMHERNASRLSLSSHHKTGTQQNLTKARTTSSNVVGSFILF